MGWGGSSFRSGLTALLLLAGLSTPWAPPLLAQAQAQGMDRCHTQGLTLAPGQGDGAAGHLFLPMLFTNTLNVPCWMYGYVGAQLLDSAGNPLPTVVQRGGGMYPDPGPSVITLGPGEQAGFELAWEDVPVGNEQTCPTASAIAVIPPDEYDALTVPVQIDACGGGQLHVTAIAPPSGLSQPEGG